VCLNSHGLNNLLSVCPLPENPRHGMPTLPASVQGEERKRAVKVLRGAQAWCARAARRKRGAQEKGV